MAFSKTKWWTADKGGVHLQLIQHVQAVEQDHYSVFNRFVRLGAVPIR
jgi:hypothetical protein